METLKEFFLDLRPATLESILRATVLIVIGLPLVRVLAFGVRKTLTKKASEQTRMIINKFIVYTGSVILIIAILHELGFNLTTLLGAAGVAGIAIGVASQTSLSNIISGVFLISEKPFEAGDIITVAEKTGIVVSVDLLSVKIRTFDNLFIRIPNQSILNNQVTNITRYPIRRISVFLRVHFFEDLERLEQILLDEARKNKYCLDEPEPFFYISTIEDYGIKILLGIWVEKNMFWEVNNQIKRDVFIRLKQEGIRIPYQHITLSETTAKKAVEFYKKKRKSIGRAQYH